MILLVNLFYFLMLLIFLIGSLVVVFHIIRYSYNKMATALMLIIFICVMGSLLMLNIVLFYSINFRKIFPSM